MQTYKIAIIGDSAVGKSTYIHRVLTGEFKSNYHPTFGVHVSNVIFETNYGDIKFEIHDKATDDYCSAKNQQFDIISGADAAIVMIDFSEFKLAPAESWLDKVRHIPSVLCANKDDWCIALYASCYLSDILVRISTKNNKNLYMPFLILARYLTKHHDIEFKYIKMPVSVVSPN